jgi:hypothetical protein
MKKLSLSLETLAVESFATAADEARPVGTVRAHLQADPMDPYAAAPAPATKTCAGNPTCDRTICFSCDLTGCYTQYPCCQIG